MFWARPQGAGLSTNQDPRFTAIFDEGVRLLSFHPSPLSPRQARVDTSRATTAMRRIRKQRLVHTEVEGPPRGPNCRHELIAKAQIPNQSRVGPPNYYPEWRRSKRHAHLVGGDWSKKKKKYKVGPHVFLHHSKKSKNAGSSARYSPSSASFSTPRPRQGQVDIGKPGQTAFLSTCASSAWNPEDVLQHRKWWAGTASPRRPLCRNRNTGAPAAVRRKHTHRDARTQGCDCRRVNARPMRTPSPEACGCTARP